MYAFLAKCTNASKFGSNATDLISKFGGKVVITLSARYDFPLESVISSCPSLIAITFAFVFYISKPISANFFD
jgi:hypothetical protein